MGENEIFVLGINNEESEMESGACRERVTKVNESLNPKKKDVLMQRLMTAKMYLSLSF